MKTYEEVVAGMKSGHTFSNMSEFERWAARWCGRCRHEDGCPIVDAAMIYAGLRPAEWAPSEGAGPFTCAAFEATR